MLKFLFGVLVGVYLIVLHAIIAAFTLVYVVDHSEEYPELMNKIFGKGATS